METINISLGVVVTLVIVALLFDFMNGFHDAANSIATIVSTRVLKPHQAVIWAASFNFIAYFLFQLKVASTIGKGTIDPAKGPAEIAVTLDHPAMIYVTIDRIDAPKPGQPKCFFARNSGSIAAERMPGANGRF